MQEMACLRIILKCYMPVFVSVTMTRIHYHRDIIILVKLTMHCNNGYIM